MKRLCLTLLICLAPSLALADHCAGGVCGLVRAPARAVQNVRENAKERRANGKGIARVLPRNWRR